MWLDTNYLGFFILCLEQNSNEAFPISLGKLPSPIIITIILKKFSPIKSQTKGVKFHHHLIQAKGCYPWRL